MKSGAKHRQVSIMMSDTDHERLETLCERLEMNVSELVRYYIRQAHAALGERVELVGPTQIGLFPTVLPDGKTAFPVPIPKQP